MGLDPDTSKIVMGCIVAAMILLAGCMSGLNLSLMSLDTNYLKVLKRSGETKKERQRAAALLLLLQNPNWLLVTLLLGNAGAVEAMPMLLDRLLNPVAAVAISTVMVLIFGEIIPQAVFVRHAVVVGSIFEWPLRVLMMLTGPVSFTVAKLLDCLVGHRGTNFFRRQEIRAFIQIQEELGREELLKMQQESEGHMHTEDGEDSDEENLTQAELQTMLGALLLKEQSVEGSMKPIEEAMTICESDRLTANTVNRLFNTGYSRIPVWSANRDRIVGYMMMKSLLSLVYAKEDEAPLVSEVRLFAPIYQDKDEPLLIIYSKFQEENAQLAIIVDADDGSKPVGILTLEDIMEKIHNIRIEDETDLNSKAPLQLLMQDWAARRRYRNEGVHIGEAGFSMHRSASVARVSHALPRKGPQSTPNQSNNGSLASPGSHRVVEVDSRRKSERKSGKEARSGSGLENSRKESNSGSGFRRPSARRAPQSPPSEPREVL